MALIDYESLTGRMLELETSHWPVQRFSLMCDALLSIMTGYDIKSTPQITSQIHALDEGIDVSMAEQKREAIKKSIKVWRYEI